MSFKLIWHVFAGLLHMLKKINLKATVIFGLVAALAFCVPTFFFILQARYSGAWLLYLGSFLFMAVIAGRLMRESRKRDVEVSTAIKVFASHIVTLAGIVIACILCFAMLSLMVPGYLHAGMADKLLTGGPASSLKDKTDGLSVDVFMAATIINFSVGSFISIIFPFFLKRNQPSDDRQPKPFHQPEQ